MTPKVNNDEIQLRIIV